MSAPCQRLDVRNPRTGEVDYWIKPSSPEDLARQSNKMREAQVRWSQAGLDQRIEALRAWRSALESERTQLIGALTADTGRRNESILELDLVLTAINRWCSLAPDLLSDGEERASSVPFIRLNEQFVPYPLVGVISPWNFPLLLSSIDAIPALLTGCSVIVKPSEIAPRFIGPVRKSITAVPELADVLAFVEGAGETGAGLVKCVDTICFTGSAETGRKVAEAAARRFIPALLELGGKDPAIVLGSADLDLAISAILWGSVVNAGQSCLSIERIYVARPILREFITGLTERARAIRLAYPLPESGPIGPIIDEDQARIIEEHLAEAVEKGATVHCGGSIERHGGGLWCRPTVLTGVTHAMKVMTEETFGPVMPVMPFSTVDEAIELANDSAYGLSAAVFAGSNDEALAVARRLEAGAISINDVGLTAMIHDGEKNSFKMSGMGGSRMGPSAIRRFVRQKAFLIKKGSDPDPWWFQVRDG